MTDIAATDRSFATARPATDRPWPAIEPTAVWLHGSLVVALVAGSTGGVFSVLGILLAVGVAARGKHIVTRGWR